MKWMLPEKPEDMMYEPPRFWEVHKIIKEKINVKKQHSLDLEEKKQEFVGIFKNLNIQFCPLDKKKIRKYKNQWVEAFSPADKNLKKIKKLCLDSHKYTPFLWHIFSFEFLNCEAEENAGILFDKEKKSTCVMISNCDDIAYTLKNAQNLSAELLEQFVDVTVTADDFSWTYSKTHESMCGPYFYKK